MSNGVDKAKAAALGIVPGALVQLKSGGPVMTVDSVGAGEHGRWTPDGDVYVS